MPHRACTIRMEERLCRMLPPLIRLILLIYGFFCSLPGFSLKPAMPAAGVHAGRARNAGLAVRFGLRAPALARRVARPFAARWEPAVACQGVPFALRAAFSRLLFARPGFHACLLRFGFSTGRSPAGISSFALRSQELGSALPAEGSECADVCRDVRLSAGFALFAMGRVLVALHVFDRAPTLTPRRRNAASWPWHCPRLWCWPMFCSADSVPPFTTRRCSFPHRCRAAANGSARAETHCGWSGLKLPRRRQVHRFRSTRHRFRGSAFLLVAGPGIVFGAGSWCADFRVAAGRHGGEECGGRARAPSFWRLALFVLLPPAHLPGLSRSACPRRVRPSHPQRQWRDLITKSPSCRRRWKPARAWSPQRPLLTENRSRGAEGRNVS